MTGCAKVDTEMLQIENLTVSYPDKTVAIDGLSLSVTEGESLALIGANGAGKTSLLLSIAGVLDKSDGTISVNGIELTKKTINQIRQKTGLVFQNPDDQLFMPMIYDDIAFGPRNYGDDEQTVKEKVDSVLERLAISKLSKKSPFKMSGGEKRIAALATVLVMDPDIMMFDEPTAFLDPKARRNLINILNGLSHTKIIATHDLKFAEEVCTRAIILKEGKIFADGKPKDLLYKKELMQQSDLEAI
jgi:cobalt/nickel transport system ATP-binding protein